MRTVLQENGVTYYVKYDYLNKIGLMDMDVPQGTDAVELSGITYVDMRYSDKVFPDVTEIIIGNDVLEIKINNFTFPNVRKITSHSDYFHSGKMLVMNIPERNDYNTLLNTFCLSENEVVDLLNIDIIDSYAFRGCETTDIINTDSVKWIKANAFWESKCITRPYVNGILQIGHMLIGVANSVNLSSNIHIPNDIYAIYESIDFTDKYVTVDDAKVLIKANLEHPPQEIIFNSCIDAQPYEGFTIIDMLPFIRNENIKNIIVNKNDRYFSSIDGVLYSKDGKELLFCPRGKYGTVTIPYGVERIKASAFERSCITNVVLPDSLRVIESYAFSCSKVKEIIFGSNVYSVGPHAFNGCNGLTSIQLNEGLYEINDYAFIGCNVKNIEIPASIRKLGFEALGEIEHVKLNGDIDLRHVVDSICLYEYDYNILSNTIEVIKDGHSVFVPRFIYQRHCNDIALGIEMKSNNIYKLGAISDSKEDTAIATYVYTHDEKIKAYLKRCSKRIAQRFIVNHHIDGYDKKLIEFLKLGLMSEKTLNDILRMANKCNNVTAASYILQAINNQNSR